LQPIYVARPILRGVPDPVALRAGVLVDRDHAVRVPGFPKPEAVPVRSAPTHSPEGKRYVSGRTRPVAQVRLEALCGAVERAAAGGRHRCLVWAAARAIELDDALTREEIAAALVAAARRAGLEDGDKELERNVANGFKIGIFGAKPFIKVEVINGVRLTRNTGAAA
jgi:hypothetical protein